MDRNELTLAVAGALVAAFLLGWILRWFFGRINARGPRNAARTADLAAQLHAAEDALHRAEARLARFEEAGAKRFAEMQAEVDAARAEAAELRAARAAAETGRQTP
jgi:hypothetical protein